MFMCANVPPVEQFSVDFGFGLGFGFTTVWDWLRSLIISNWFGFGFMTL